MMYLETWLTSGTPVSSRRAITRSTLAMSSAIRLRTAAAGEVSAGWTDKGEGACALQGMRRWRWRPERPEAVDYSDARAALRPAGRRLAAANGRGAIIMGSAEFAAEPSYFKRSICTRS